MSRLRKVLSLILSLSAAKLSACVEMRLTFGAKARPEVCSCVFLYCGNDFKTQSAEEGESIVLNGMKEFCAEE